MNSRNFALWLRQHAFSHRVGTRSSLEKSWVEVAKNWLGTRQASPQPLCEQVVQPHPSAPQTRACKLDRGSEEQIRWERFLYTLYKVRGEAMDRHVKPKSARSKNAHDDLLLPLWMLAGRGAPAAGGKWPEMYYKELQVELGAMRQMQDKLVETVKKTMRRGAGPDLPTSRSLIARWLTPLTKAIQAEQKSILNGEGAVDRQVYGPFLLLLPAHVLANATLHGFISSMLMSDQLGLNKVLTPCLSIGKNIKQQVEMDLLKAKARRVNRQRLILQRKLRKGNIDVLETGAEWSSDWFQNWRANLLKDPKFRNMDDTIIRQELVKRFKELKPFEIPDPAESDANQPLGSSMVVERKRNADLSLLEGAQGKLEKAVLQQEKHADEEDRLRLLNRALNRARQATRNWQSDKIVKVGARLLELMLNNCSTLEWDPVAQQAVKVPAIQHYILKLKDRKQGWIKLHNSVTRQLAKFKEVKGFLLPAYQPMVIPPLPWRGIDFGGYLIARSNVMRHRFYGPQRQALYDADSPHNRLGQVYDGLTALGETAWRINREMLALISHAATSELEICDLPRAYEMPIGPPEKRPRFRVTGGGFWQEYPEKRQTRARADPFARAESIAQTSVIGDPAAGAAAAPADLLFPEDDPDGWGAAGQDVGPGNTEAAVLVRGEGGGEGDSFTAPLRKRKGLFRRTQLLATFTTAETEFERRIRRIKNGAVRKANREAYSLRCHMNIKLDVAQKFLNEEAIYFPHNLDFRGRAYPMHPHLHHLGNDLCRGLLEFAEGKPLGPHGLSWLFVQLANMWGNGEDKKGFEARHQFVRDNLDDIVGSAARPLEHTWWQDAEEPWQFLAACKDVARAVACEDPEAYCSHQPVAMDGSCNGLQHYAALSRDRPGGAAVNLTPADKPQDVYSQVAAIVAERVSVDAEKGNRLAQLVVDQIDRKLVKQTVMTSVYGVTFVGARDQIARRLRERGLADDSKFDKFQLAHYAAQQTLGGLHKRFSQAKLVMDWLTDCARLIARTGNAVQWVTPLGLPVVQPYKKQAIRHVNTTLQRVVLRSEKQNDQPILTLRQRTAFPPNFIHSIDSAHMLMTASACKAAGLAFAGVHDSFWTHAATVPELNTLLRQTYVELYTKPILENLLEQFRERYPAIDFPPIPKKGDLRIEEVLDARYFFS